MSASMLLMVALVGVLLFVTVALCYRLWKLRQVGGTAAILRDVPAVGGHGWRHGVMRYQGGEATVLEVVDAQTTLTQARNAYDDAWVRYRVALANLQTLTGSF